MNKLCTLSTLVFLLSFSLEMTGATAPPGLILLEEDSSYVLLLAHKKSKRQFVITPGDRVRYRILGSERSAVGILEGFKKDENKLIIDGKSIPLTGISLIKKKDPVEISFLKFFGTIGVIATTFWGLFWATVFFRGSLAILGLPSVVGGTVIAVISLFLIGAIIHGMNQAALKSIHTIYSAKIVPIDEVDVKKHR